jgi:UDP-glucose 4-epimerase
MAAHANIRESLVDHRSDLENNPIGTLNILEAMCKNNVGDMVFASTSAVYGEAMVRPTPEDYFPIQTSLYGASKLACEAYAEAYTEFAPLRFWAFRFANVIGERCRRGVIWDFVHKLLKNPAELEILGDGKQSKEYLYVKDCVEGMMIGYKKASGKANIFNLGVEEQTIVDRIADLVIEEMNLDKDKVKRKYTGGPRGWIGDNPVVQLSLERVKKLGWRQKVSSEEAVRRTTRWILEHEIKRR